MASAWFGMVMIWFDGLQIHLTGVFLESQVTHELPPYEVAEQRGTERQAGKQRERQGGKEARRDGIAVFSRPVLTEVTKLDWKFGT